MTEDRRCRWCDGLSNLTICAGCGLALCRYSDHTHKNEEMTVCGECWDAPAYQACQR